MATWETRLQNLVTAKLEGSDPTNVIREIIGVLAEMGTPLSGTSRGLPAIQAEIVKVQTEMSRQDMRITAAEAAAVAAAGSKGNQTKGILESKAIMGIKPLKDDKSGFRTWHEKFVNALAQTIPGTRNAFAEIVKKVQTQDMDQIIKGEWDKTFSGKCSWDALGEDLYCILVEKCEGEALTRVRNAGQGNGITAYSLIYQWFTGTSGMAIC